MWDEKGGVCEGRRAGVAKFASRRILVAESLRAHNQMDIKEVECLIKGRVQMVLFRDFTQRNARVLSLIGFVKNNKDGSVTAVAQGPEESLKKFILKLNKGSFLSKVEKVTVEWRPPSQDFVDFVILY